MNILSAAIALLLAILLILFGISRVGSWLIERRHPPVGSFMTVNDTRLHFVHVAAPASPELPAMVFVHGASGNLNDQMVPIRRLLEGRAELLFVDRPGHGWSDRGPARNHTPDGQADTIAALMDRLDIGKALITGHSFGSAVVASFALSHPERTGGLLFLAPATHPWPGGGTSWYYELTAKPFVGRLFAETLALPAGLMRMEAATKCVFAPNRVPDGYLEQTGIELVLRSAAFRANAIDVEGLYRFVNSNASNYNSITAPTIIITGNRDTVVYEEIHSRGLASDIPGAELLSVNNLGHKPDFVATDLVVAALEKLAGQDRDLGQAVEKLEQRIVSDAFGPIERCPDEKPTAIGFEPSTEKLTAGVQKF